MKAHKTVTLTRRMLEDGQACYNGTERVKSLLPAKISTDPLDNLDLADKAMRIWEVAGISNQVAFLPDPSEDFQNTWVAWPDNQVNDTPYVLAQQLANWADAYLVARGR